ncbi:MAG: serine protein kinase RIO [Candidatus Odinarchaeota archaeon]
MSGDDHFDFFVKKQRKFDAETDKRRKKIKHDQDRKSVDDVVDFSTAKVLEKFIRQDYIKEVTGIISTGKEANVYIGLIGEKSKEQLLEQGFEQSKEQKYVAIKVYRTRVIEFKNFQRYIHGDPRFKSMSKSSHKLITEWALKEYKNLARITKAGIKAPVPVAVKRNVLLAQFIGESNLPAPLLKDMEGINYEKLYKELIETIKKLFLDADLVHADLSEYNLLYYNGSCFIIDVGQAVLDSHPEALTFLKRDINNLNYFFNKKGIEELQDPVKMIKGMLKEKGTLEDEDFYSDEVISSG